MRGDWGQVTEASNSTIEPFSPGSPSLVAQYVWDHDSIGQVWLAQQAQTYGVTRFYLNAWNAPPFMTSLPGQNFGGVLCAGPGSGCTDDWRQAYANYLVQYLRFYQSDGINITHLGAFNEPDIPGNAGATRRSTTMQRKLLLLKIFDVTT